MPPKNTSFGQIRRLNRAKASEFSLVQSYHLGYRNREDKTMLPSGVLITGSKNVLTNTSGRIAARKGYTLDGQSDSTDAPILSSFDWLKHNGEEQHLRSGNGKLQFRYVAANGDIWNGHTFTSNQVYWIDLITGLSDAVKFQYTDYWDTAAVQSLLLMVNGTPDIKVWTGGVVTMASATVNTITKTGSTTWAEEGFSATGSITVNGVTATYTGGYATTTLTGVSVDFSATAANTVVFQTVQTVTNGSMSLAQPQNDLISILRNQVYIGCLTTNNVYISAQNNYQSYSFSTPRIVGEGATVYLDGACVAFIPQEQQMYISAGKDLWYETKFTLSADLANESFEIIRLKTASQQAAQSQNLVAKDKNNVVFVSNEPVLTTIGRVSGVVLTPQAGDISYPIINDFNNYNFTDGSVKYFKNFIFVAIPKESVVRMYNQTDAKNHYWEAPLTMPISCFSIIDGELYGHSYLTPQTFKLFDGYNDNGTAIESIATFSFNNYNTRFATKSFNEFYQEGYISSNTTLTLSIQYEIDGCATTQTFDMAGTERFVCTYINDASLGKVSLGKNPLGGTLQNVATLPPKFRKIKTFPRVPFYEESTTFSSNGVDQQWELLAFGPAVQTTSEGNNSITD